MICLRKYVRNPYICLTGLNFSLLVRFKIRNCVFLLTCFVLTACNPLRHLKKDQILLNKNVIITDHKELKEDLNALLKPTPNRKLLGFFRFNLDVYNLADKEILTPKDSSKFREWVKKTIGEKPVLLDTFVVTKTSRQLTLFMQQKGFFRAEVKDTIVYKRNHRLANVFFTIKANQAYTIRDIIYTTPDTLLIPIVQSMRASSLIKTGDNYDESVLEHERENLALDMKNRGYYYFSKEYIHYLVDSALMSNQVNLLLKVNMINVKKNDTIQVGEFESHHVYHLRKILIETDYDPLATSVDPRDSLICNEYCFVKHPVNQKFSPPRILQTIFLKPKDYFQQRNLEETYKRLNELGVFKFVNIKFDSVPIDDNHPEYLLDVHIQLTPAKKQSHTESVTGTQHSGDLGMAGDISYQNRNSLGGLEMIELKLKGALEAQKVAATSDTKTNYLFNTIEYGPEVNFNVPAFLFIPKGLKKGLSQKTNPKTTITAAYGKQKRPDYDRSVLNFNLGYAGVIPSKTQTLFWYPFEIGFVRIKKSASFDSTLKAIGDQSLINSYSNHLTTDMRIVWLWNNQEAQIGKKTYWSHRLAGEMSGMIPRQVNRWLRNPTDLEGRYEFLGNVFAQYWKLEYDFRYFYKLNIHNSFAFRFAPGVGFPNGNSTSMPFEKAFFGGGANDIRAWTTRSLGPGSSYNPTISEHAADTKLIGSVEYRTDLFWLLKGALFVDAGNIWMKKKDPNNPGAEFNLSRFQKEIAIGGGVGIRMDFGFFLIRVDAAEPLKRPFLPEGHRWAKIKELRFNNIRWNLGIGYPF